MNRTICEIFIRLLRTDVDICHSLKWIQNDLTEWQKLQTLAKLEITGDGFLVPEGRNDGQVEVEMKQKIWPEKNASIKIKNFCK